MITTIRIRDLIKYLVILTMAIVLLVLGTRYFFRIKSNVGAGLPLDSPIANLSIGQCGHVPARERTELCPYKHVLTLLSHGHKP